MKLDLKKFRKIEEGDKHTTLEHESGHLLKIAHKSLDKYYRKELSELPLHKARGGKISFKEFSKNYEASKTSKPAESSNTMPGSPTDAKSNYTEPQDIGTKGYTDKGNYNDVALAALKREAPPFGPLGTDPKQHYPPCINPSCKSYGKPHPNCRCYGGMSEHSGAGEAGHFAEGGKVSESHFCSEDRSHQPDCEYYADGGQAPMTSPSPADTIEQTPAAQQQPQMNTSTEASSAAPAEQQPEQQPGASNINNAYQSAYDTMAKEHADFAADSAAGHITPKTYADLFNKNPDGSDRGGLAKVGTLFGLLVGGAGAGLSHQPNMLMQMMDNEINRDVAAQEASQKNRQSFMSINGQNLQALANAGKIGQDTRAMQFATTKAMTSYAYYDQLAKYANSLPPGSDSYNKAQQQLIVLKDAMDKDNASGFAKAAAANAISAQLSPSGAGQPSEQQFAKQQVLRESGYAGPEQKAVGEQMTARHIPGVPGVATRPVAPADQQQVKDMNVLSDKAKDLIDYAQKHVGTLKPAERATAKQKAEELINFYNSSLGGTLGEGRLSWLQDQIKTNPTGVIPYLLGNQATLKEILKSNDHRKGILLQSYGLQPQQTSSASSDQIKTVNGVKWKRGSNGEAIKVE